MARCRQGPPPDPTFAPFTLLPLIRNGEGRNLPVPLYNHEQHVTVPVKSSVGISATAPNSNLDSMDSLAVRSWPAGARRSLLSFDCSSAFDPSVESLYKVELHLYISNLRSKRSAVEVRAMPSSVASLDTSKITWNCGEDADPYNLLPDCAEKWNGGFFSSPASASYKADGEWMVLDVTALAQSGAHSFLLISVDESKGATDVEFARTGEHAPFLNVTVPAIPPPVYPPAGCEDRFISVEWPNEQLTFHVVHCAKKKGVLSSEQRTLQELISLKSARDMDLNVVFLHGVPSNAFMWRNVLASLTDVATVWAVDAIGAGQSSNPNPQKFDYLYESQAKANTLLLDKLNLSNIILILEDWGSLVGMNYVVDRPERVAGYVMWETLLRICGPEFEIEHTRCSECINVGLEYFFNESLPSFAAEKDREYCYKLDNMTASENEIGIGKFRYFFMPGPQFLTTRTLSAEEKLGYSKYADKDPASRFAFSRWPFSLTDESQTPFMLGLVQRLLALHAKLRKSTVPGRSLAWSFPPFGNAVAGIVDTGYLKEAYPSIKQKEVHPWSGHFMAESFPFAVQKEIRDFLFQEIVPALP
ncbi:hypothetical protein QOT17_017417 [Balamuthia mandrillaris]